MKYDGRCLLLRLFNPSKLWGSLHKEFRLVYDDNAIQPAYRQPYNELLTAAHTIRQLFTDIEKEAY